MIQMANFKEDGMMRYWNLTYNDPDRWAECYAISGEPVSFLKGIMQGGTGSPRGVIVSLPGEAGEMLDETSNVNYCNIQRTESGGILYFKVRLEVYGIPLGENDIRSLRIERRKSESFPYLLHLILKSGQTIQISCLQDKVGAWERFLNNAFDLQ